MRKHIPSHKGIVLRIAFSIGLALIIIFVLSITIPPEPQYDSRLPLTERDRALLTAFNTVKQLENYQRNGGGEITLFGEEKLSCESCYRFSLGFNVRNHLDAAKTDSVIANITIQSSETVDIKYAQKVG